MLSWPALAAVAPGTETSGNVTTTASPVVNAPASLGDGDLVIVMFGLNDVMTQHASPTLNGFTSCSPQTTGDGSIHALYKIASSEGASWTFTDLWTAATSGRYASVRFTGVHASDPLDSLGCNLGTTQSVTTPITVSVTPAGDGRMFVAMFGGDPGASPTGTAGCTAACTGTDPTATEMSDSVNLNSGYVYIEYYLQTTAGAEDLNFTATVSLAFRSFLFILQPAAGGGGGNPPTVLGGEVGGGAGSIIGLLRPVIKDETWVQQLFTRLKEAA